MSDGYFTWNHRLVVVDDDPYTIQLCEVMYDPDTDVPTGYGETFTCGESIEEMRELVERWQVALTQPILHHSSMPVQEEGNE